jgi:hypothetical protein
MRTHRASYLKTVVVALGVSATALALAAYGLAEDRGSLTGWMLFESRLLRWASAAGLVALGLVCLLVAVGGLFALYEDAKEGLGRAEPGTR